MRKLSTFLKQFILLFSIASFAFVSISCTKLSYAPDATEIKFAGIKSIQLTREGNLIIAWDSPDPSSAEVVGFDVYMQELTTLALTDQVVSSSSSSSSSPGNENTATSAGIIVDLDDVNGPKTKGKVVGSISGGTSFTMENQFPGNYAFQVVAIGKDGARDTNTKVLLYTVPSNIIFAGLEIAEVVDQEIVLRWSEYVTDVKGEPIYYVVFEGEAFNNPIKIVSEGLEYRISTNDKLPGSLWNYGVRVKDPLGQLDNNANVKTVQIPEDSAEYAGCISGTALGADQIQVEFEYPPSAEKVNIYRNGVVAFSTSTPSTSSFKDIGLVEGQTYEYKCEAVRLGSGKIGTNVLKVTTLNSNPPTFAGIVNVTVDSPTSVTASWGVATGVPSQYFVIYGSLGTQLDWSSEPLKTTESSNLSIKLTGFGDELPYTFGVRACTSSDVCDLNTITITVNMPDGGAPTTVGPTAAEVKNGEMHVTAPWEHPDGAVLKRKVYVSLGSAEQAKNFDNYTLKKTVVADSLLSPPTDLVIDTLTENKDYYIIVLDEDPSGNVSQNYTYIMKNSGDLKAPTFSGITSLALGPDGSKENTLTAGFVALAPEIMDPSGASHYMIYLKEGGGNACQDGVFKNEFTAAAYEAGKTYEYNITGLKARTMYGVCIKARDMSGNISATDSFLSKSTIDTTPPIFDGIQNLFYDEETGEMNVVWNASSSSDTMEYKVKIWKNEAIPPESFILSMTRSHPEYKTGFKFTNSHFDFGSNDTVYVSVNACDNAGYIPGGQQNCTSFPMTGALFVTLADIDPPPNFAGIASDSSLLTPIEGTITVAWLAPPDWTDYRGFKIYIVNPSTYALDFVKLCACSANGCPEQLTSCDLTGLDPFRTYLLHVRAYDEVGNITILDPVSKSTFKRTSDTTKPTFSSNLTLEYASGKSSLTWSKATDNQYATEPNAVITYHVYRKTDSSFSNPLAPMNDGELITSLPDTFLDDNKNYISGKAYYYSVCASDGSENISCDGNIKNITTPDMIPPTITNFKTSKTENDKIWNLTWEMSDNVAGALLVKIRKTHTPTEPGPVTPADSPFLAGYDLLAANDLTGPKNEDTYINYLLTVEDVAGNMASAELHLFSENKIIITAIKEAEGPLDGGKYVVFEGQGFHPSTTIKFGSGNALEIQKITKNMLICKTPGNVAGIVTVTAENSDGSKFIADNAYTYCSEENCTNICNKPTSWGTYFAKGDGSATDPYFICSPEQLDNIRFKEGSTYIGYYKYFELGDNINLIDYDTNNFLPISNYNNGYFYGWVDGKGHVVANYTFHAPVGTNNVGLFGAVAGGHDIKNLGVVNADVSGASSVGALIGYIYASTSTVENCFSTGTVVGSDGYIGGVIGLGYANTINVYSTANVTGGHYVGGVVGDKRYTGALMYSTGNVTATGYTSGTLTSYCHVGGVAGYWSGNGQTLENAHATGDVECQTATGQCTGGLFGCAGSFDLKNNYATGKVTGGAYVGGLVGSASTMTIDGSYATGEVSGKGVYIGGLTGGLSNAKIKNSYATNNVTGYSYGTGGLVGYMAGATTLIEKSYATGSVSAPENINTSAYIGGLVGYANGGTISESWSSSVVSTENKAPYTGGNYYVGGLVGYQHTTIIQKSYATGDVISPNGIYVGGLVGRMCYLSNLVTESYATNSVTGNDAVGGLIGGCRANALGPISKSYATGPVTGRTLVGGFCGNTEDGGTDSPEVDITECYATGDVYSFNQDAGGFVGRLNSGTVIEKSYSTGDVEGDAVAGGFVGQMYYQNMKIKQCYATGNVVGNQYVGGFLGYSYYAGGSEVFDNYSTGTVTGGDYMGGFAGYSADVLSRVYATGRTKQKISGVGNIGGLLATKRIDTTYPGLGSFPENMYWDLNTVQVTTSVAGSGRSTSEMKTQTNYSGWDFTDIWKMGSEGYPIFIWQDD